MGDPQGSLHKGALGQGPHTVMSVLVWGTESWVWGCQTLRDPFQLPLSSSKAGHIPALPAGEPARTHQDLLQPWETLGHPDNGQRPEKEEKYIRYERRSG